MYLHNFLNVIFSKLLYVLYFYTFYPIYDFYDVACNKIIYKIAHTHLVMYPSFLFILCFAYVLPFCVDAKQYFS